MPDRLNLRGTITPSSQLGKPFLRSHHPALFHLPCRTRTRGTRAPPAHPLMTNPHDGYREAAGTPSWPHTEGVPSRRADMGPRQPLRCWHGQLTHALPLPPSWAWCFATGTSAVSECQSEVWGEAAPTHGPSQPAWRGGPRRATAEALSEPGLTFTSEKITPSKLCLCWGPSVRHEWKRRLPWEPRGCVCCSRVSSLLGLLMSRLTSSQLTMAYAYLRMDLAAFTPSLPSSQLLSSALLLAAPSPSLVTPCGDQCWGAGSGQASPGDVQA